VKNTQPYLIFSETDADNNFGKFYIKADDHIIPVGNNALVAADYLIKLHYIFDISFALELTNFYNFISGCLMNFSIPKACVRELYETLQNV